MITFNTIMNNDYFLIHVLKMGYIWKFSFLHLRSILFWFHEYYVLWYDFSLLMWSYHNFHVYHCDSITIIKLSMVFCRLCILLMTVYRDNLVSSGQASCLHGILKSVHDRYCNDVMVCQETWYLPPRPESFFLKPWYHGGMMATTI